MCKRDRLQDVVEDTPATMGDVESEFGPPVAGRVEALTDVSRPSDGNRAVRKEIDRRHTAHASPRAKTIKLADLIDNCEDIAHHDPRFAQVYLQEMEALLAVLGEGDALCRMGERDRCQLPLVCRRPGGLARVAPAVTQQQGLGDRYVHGARSRFLTEPVMKKFQRVTAGETTEGRGAHEAAAGPRIDVASRLRDMW